MSEMDAIVKEFLLESKENLDQLDQDLIELEKDPTSQPMLAGIFRTIHSIKGATGFLGFAKLGGVAHAGDYLHADGQRARRPLRDPAGECGRVGAAR
jgi:two-component system chemotaxis sensor kinase CheA